MIACETIKRVITDNTGACRTRQLVESHGKFGIPVSQVTYYRPKALDRIDRNKRIDHSEESRQLFIVLKVKLKNSFSVNILSPSRKSAMILLHIYHRELGLLNQCKLFFLPVVL